MERASKFFLCLDESCDCPSEGITEGRGRSWWSQVCTFLKRLPKWTTNSRSKGLALGPKLRLWAQASSWSSTRSPPFAQAEEQTPGRFSSSMRLPNSSFELSHHRATAASRAPQPGHPWKISQTCFPHCNVTLWLLVLCSTDNILSGCCFLLQCYLYLISFSRGEWPSCCALPLPHCPHRQRSPLDHLQCRSSFRRCAHKLARIPAAHCPVAGCIYVRASHESIYIFTRAKSWQISFAMSSWGTKMILFAELPVPHLQFL